MGKEFSSEVPNTTHLKNLLDQKAIPFVEPASWVYGFSPLSPTVLLPWCVCYSLDNILRIQSSTPGVLKSKLALESPGVLFEPQISGSLTEYKMGAGNLHFSHSTRLYGCCWSRWKLAQTSTWWTVGVSTYHLPVSGKLNAQASGDQEHICHRIPG